MPAPAPRDRIRLEGIALIGRTRAEYLRYFDLARLRPGDTVLDVGAGVSSFCAEMHEAGFGVTAADPVYRLSPEGIAARSDRDLAAVVAQLPDVAHNYNWDFHADVEGLKRHRLRARDVCLRDLTAHPERYVAAGLPDTGLPDDAYDLVLVSYLLFLYDERLDYAFHKAALLELARVARAEVQVYPVTGLDGRPSPHLERLRADPDLGRLSLTLQQTGFAFLKGADQRLVVRAR